MNIGWSWLTGNRQPTDRVHNPRMTATNIHSMSIPFRPRQDTWQVPTSCWSGWRMSSYRSKSNTHQIRRSMFKLAIPNGKWYTSSEDTEILKGDLDTQGCLEKRMTTLSSILAWTAPWTEEPGGLQSVGLQRIGRSWELDPQGCEIFIGGEASIPQRGRNISRDM